MIAIIKVRFWDDFNKCEKIEYQGLNPCDSFVEAAEYANSYYGDSLIELSIEILDNGLILTEENVELLRRGAV